MPEIELNWAGKRTEVAEEGVWRLAFDVKEKSVERLELGVGANAPLSLFDSEEVENILVSEKTEPSSNAQRQTPDASPHPNALLLGDNFHAMCALMLEFEGKFDLIYLDPPFFTQKEWKTREREHAYSDTWKQGLPSYLQFLYDRIFVARKLLSETGCLYLHLDWQASHYAKLILDEIFGSVFFQNEIIWCYREAINSRKRWNRKHDTILFYSKTETYTFNPATVLEPYSEGAIKKFRNKDEKGPYRLMGRGITDSPLRSKRDIPQEMETLHPELTYRHYLGDGTLPVDYWFIDIENQASPLRTGYPTQKPEALLEKIILASTNPGDLAGDFFCGSGTTLAVANRLGRRWVGADSGELAIKTSSERLAKQSANFELGRVVLRD